ncbi:MAG: PucR family transcriptional regulator [Tractidigestivibacter sp.]|jgi:hypothetical protein|uniref:PucR family transcriptional regulator n=1 Tax=Tractidigestivibacter sp. TaxID=2847320 RepID=UPI003D90F269
MNLNLHVIKTELHQYQLLGEPKESYFELPFGFALPYREDADPIPGAIYVASAEDFEGDGKACPSCGYVCVGNPPDWLSEASVLYAEDTSVDPQELLESIAVVFSRYDRWNTQLTQALTDHAEPSRFGALARAMEPNPIFVASPGMKFLFLDAEVLKEESPSEYKQYLERLLGADRPAGISAYPSGNVLNDVISNPDFNTFSVTSEPALYPDDNWPYRTIAYNLKSNGLWMGTLCADEVLHPFTGRDYTVLKILGDYVLRSIQEYYEERFERSNEANYVLDNLLGHHFIDAWRIEGVVREFGWEMHDTYACLVIESQSYNKNERLFSLYHGKLAQALNSSCAATHDNRLVYVVDLTKNGWGPTGLVDKVEPLLRQCLLRAGVSRTYRDFKDLYYYFRQGRTALRLLASQRSGEREPVLALYDDIAASDILNRYQRDDPAEATYPEGLKRLIAYDREHDMQLVRTLKVYLDSSMRMTETSKKLYMARNTCIYQVKRIEEISGLDLNNPDTRLCLNVALKVMGTTSEKSS